MEDIIDETNEPLNPYAKAFFGLWALVALALAGFQTLDFSREKSAQHWYPASQTMQTVEVKQLSFDATTRLSSTKSIRQNCIKTELGNVLD